MLDPDCAIFNFSACSNINKTILFDTDTSLCRTVTRGDIDSLPCIPVLLSPKTVYVTSVISGKVSVSFLMLETG